MKKILYAVILLFLLNTANATFIEETWTATVKSTTQNNVNDVAKNVSSNGFEIGDTVSWTVTYSLDDNTHWSRYLDGENNNAEKGSGDDILTAMLCLDSNFNPLCNSADYITALFNSSTDTSDIYNTLLNALDVDKEVYDYFDFNQDSRSFGSPSNTNYTQHEVYSDEFNFNADNRQFPQGGAGQAQLFYINPNDEIWVSRIGFGDISIESKKVPEPSVVALMGLGLFGLFVVYRRKP